MLCWQLFMKGPILVLYRLSYRNRLTRGARMTDGSGSTTPEAGKTAERERPLYQVIQADLREAILGGSFADGAELPSETKLMEQYKTSRPTAHRAVVELQSEGLVEIRRAKPAIVRLWKPVVRNVGNRMSSEVWGAGLSVWTEETEGRERGLDHERVFRGEGPEMVAAEFGSPDAWIRHRRHLVDKRPVMLSRSYYPAAIVDGSPITRQDTGPGGAPARLADLGHAIHKGREEFRPRFATPEERELLDLPKGGIVTHFVRRCWDADGNGVEVTEMIAAGDAFIFQLDYTT